MASISPSMDHENVVSGNAREQHGVSAADNADFCLAAIS